MIRNNSSKKLLLVFISLLPFLLCSGCTNNKKVVDVNTDKVINQKANNKNTNEDNPKIEDVTDNQLLQNNTMEETNKIQQEKLLDSHQSNFEYYTINKIDSDYTNSGLNITNSIIVNGNLIGQYKNGKYKCYNELDINNLLEQKYTVYQNNNIFTDIRVKIDSNQDIPFFMPVNTIPKFNKWEPYIALSNNYNYTNKRFTIEENLVSSQEVEIIRDILDKKGFNNTPVIINKIISSDIDNDSNNEKIIYATNFYTTENELDITTHNNFCSNALNNTSNFSQLKSLDNICAYTITVFINDKKVYILDERYKKLFDYQFKDLTDKEKDNLIKADNNIDILHSNNNLIYLFDINNQIALFKTIYLAYYDEGFSCYLDIMFLNSFVIDLLDIDHDNSLEVIFYKETKPESPSPQVNIYKYKDDKLFSVIEQSIPY